MSKSSEYQRLRAHLAFLRLSAAAEALPGMLDTARTERLNVSTTSAVLTTPLAPTSPTYAAWSQTWLAELAHLRASSLARAESATRSRLVPAFGDTPIDQITTAMVRRWVARLVAQGLAPSTVTRTLRVLSSCLQAAAEDGLIPTNPARGIRPPQAQRHEQRFLTASEVALLADTIDQRYRGMVLLGCWGGLRFGEMVGLRVRCVNPLHGTVLVERAVVEVGGHQIEGPPKTAAGRRTVPLPRLVVDELLPYLAGKGPDDLVFSAPEGGMVRRTIWAARFWRPAVQVAGLAPLRVHDMRHTAVALWKMSGVVTDASFSKVRDHRPAGSLCVLTPCGA
jgi:integrase